MLVGLIVYLTGQRHLPRDGARAAAAKSERLTAAERTRLAALLAIWPLVTCFWIAQSQVWTVYNLWVRDHLDRQVGGMTVPVPWLQALDGLAPVLVMPLFLALWRRQAEGGREPDSLAKRAIGCLVFGGGTAWLSLAPLVSDAGRRAPLLWAVAFHLLTNIGWLYVTPIATALYAAEAPAGLRGTLLGVNTLSTFAGSVISGRMGVLYERWEGADFWLLHAAVVAGAGLALLAIRPALRRRLTSA